jgi:hypothetical protein
MTRLRGPDGSPSDPDDLVGSSGSAPASAAPMKNLAPWPAPGESRVRGPLGWTDEETAAYFRNFTFPELTPEEKAEARRENEFLEALGSGVVREAFESKAIYRKTPGRKPVGAIYLKMAQKCLDKANGNFARARETFIEQAMELRGIQRGSAESRWAEAVKTLFPDR